MSFTRQLNYALILVCLLFSCKTQKKKITQSDSSRYDLLNPVIVKLPEALAEISGIVYNPSDTSVFAIEDEDGLFFKIYLTKQTAVKKWRFDKKHDFEDVVVRDSTFYVLISNGDIESVRFGGNDSIITNISKFPDASKKTNEFESLYYDDSLQQLILLCKSCDDDNSKTLTAWSYDITTQIYTPSVYTIDIQPIETKIGIEKFKLKPSATAINPLTNELYILSSVNHLIIVTDRKGVFKELYTLDPKIYKQAEGIAFTPSGEMLISNEWHETGVANILIIKNKKKVL